MATTGINGANYRPDLSEYGVVIPPEPDLPAESELGAYLAELAAEAAGKNADPTDRGAPTSHVK
jgi:hypothetical protein